MNPKYQIYNQGATIHQQNIGDNNINKQKNNFNPEVFKKQEKTSQGSVFDIELNSRVELEEKALYHDKVNILPYEDNDVSEEALLYGNAIVSIWQPQDIHEGKPILIEVDKRLKLPKESHFHDQLSGCVGTGFLIDSKKGLVLSAYHCLGKAEYNQGDVVENKIVFNFDSGVNIDTALDSYSCEYAFGNKGEDWIVVKLKDFKESRHTICLLSKEEPKKDEPLYMLGHPLGLSLKYSFGGKVTYVEESKSHFKHNLDAFGGNSGSPVFSCRTNKVVGLLQKGGKDFDFDGTMKKYKEGCEVCLSITAIPVDDFKK
jgi:hypothetical protein